MRKRRGEGWTVFVGDNKSSTGPAGRSEWRPSPRVGLDLVACGRTCGSIWIAVSLWTRTEHDGPSGPHSLKRQQLKVHLNLVLLLRNFTKILEEAS